MKNINLKEYNNLKIVCDISNYVFIVQKSAMMFLNNINYLIAATSDVCYYPHPVEFDKNNKILTLPITIQYHNEECKSLMTLINKRIETIKNTIIKMKYESNGLKSVARVFKMYDIDHIILIIKE